MENTKNIKTFILLTIKIKHFQKTNFLVHFSWKSFCKFMQNKEPQEQL